MKGVEVDSSARSYAPCCHPDTRKGLRDCITRWVDETPGPSRRRLFWLLGSAGVGKSAVAQTVAEEMKAVGRLGASLFFSRLSKRDDPDQVISTLAYQLAVRSQDYKRIITI
ncbi:hypothetical protein AN958_10557 [Leucoagaricus sp. SymC.cos]|nr:hypothetical protein AN958_10557 [Leucoagaricus sp. SymC.cos]